MSRVELFGERVLEAGWLIILSLIPTYFDIYSSRVFEPDKTIFFRCLVLLMVVVQAVQLVHRRASATTPVGPIRAFGSSLRRVSRSNPLLWPVFAVIAAATLATTTSIDPWPSFYGSYQRMQGTLTLFAYIAFFLILVAHLRTAAQVNRLIRVAILTAFPISVYGIVQHLQLDPLPWGGDVTFRVTSTMGNAIFLAAYLIMIIPLTAARWVIALSRSRDEALPATGPVRRWVSTTAVVLALQLAGLAVPIMLHDVAPSVWWLVPVIIAGIALAIASRPSPPPSRLASRIEAACLGLLLLLQIGCVVLTQSRGPWLGLLAAAVAFVVLLQLVGNVNRRLLGGTIAAIAFVALFLIAFNLRSSPLAPLRGLPYVGRLGQLTEVDDGTGRVRVLIWQGTQVLLTQHPSIGFSPDPISALRPIVGYGPEAMRLAYNVVYPPELGDIESRNASPDRNHNDLLDHLVEGGILGLLAYVFLVVSGFVLARRAFRGTERFEQAAIVVGLVASLAGHLTETQTGIAIVSTKLYFWTILALLAVVSLHPTVLAPEVTLPASPKMSGEIAEAGSRSRRSTRRSLAPAIEAPPRRGLSPSSRRGLLVWAWFSAVVVGTHTIATVAFAAGSSGVEIWVYLSFAWAWFAAVVYALAATPWPGFASWRRPELAAAVAGLVVAIGLARFDLNHVTADIYHKQGTELALKQRYAESTRAFARAFSLAPDQDYYALFLGRAFMDLGSHTASQATTAGQARSIDQLLNLDESSLAKFDRNDSFLASETALLRARELAPLDPDHVANLARLYQFWGQSTDPSKLVEAVRFAGLASQLSPHSPELLDEWAVMLTEQGNFLEAQNKARLAVELDPPFAATHVVLGDVYLERQDAVDAMAEHQQALSLDSSALSDDNFDHRINLYIQQGQGTALAETFRRLVVSHPERGNRMAYAYVATKTGQLSVAMEQYQTLVRLDPTDWLAYRNLATAYSQTGNRVDARAAGEAALKAAPADQKPPIQSFLSGLASG